MTIIADQFKKLILEKTEEEENNSLVRGKNIIVLEKRFKCAICFRTSRLPDGFWGVQRDLIPRLKETGYPYVFIFLLSQDFGWLLRDKVVDEFFRKCSQGKGDYKVHQEELKGDSNVWEFRTMDEFIECLSPYSCRNEQIGHDIESASP